MRICLSESLLKGGIAFLIAAAFLTFQQFDGCVSTALHGYAVLAEREGVYSRIKGGGEDTIPVGEPPHILRFLQHTTARTHVRQLAFCHGIFHHKRGHTTHKVVVIIDGTPSARYREQAEISLHYSSFHIDIIGPDDWFCCCDCAI